MKEEISFFSFVVHQSDFLVICGAMWGWGAASVLKLVRPDYFAKSKRAAKSRIEEMYTTRKMS